jgi:hypothetical protein
MRNIRRDLKRAILTGVETSALAVAILTGVFVGVWGAEVSSPPGDAILEFPWLFHSNCPARPVRSINLPINGDTTSTTTSGPILGTGER